MTLDTFNAFTVRVTPQIVLWKYSDQELFLNMGSIDLAKQFFPCHRTFHIAFNAAICFHRLDSLVARAFTFRAGSRGFESSGRTIPKV